MENLSKIEDLLEKSTSNNRFKEYYGNGKDAIRGVLETHSVQIGRYSVKFEKKIVVYSYRWHKGVWQYYINDILVNRAAVKRLVKSFDNMY